MGVWIICNVSIIITSATLPLFFITLWRWVHQRVLDWFYLLHWFGVVLSLCVTKMFTLTSNKNKALSCWARLAPNLLLLCLCRHKQICWARGFLAFFHLGKTGACGGPCMTKNSPEVCMVSSSKFLLGVVSSAISTFCWSTCTGRHWGGIILT